jgi:hypothetical protein
VEWLNTACCFVPIRDFFLRTGIRRYRELTCARYVFTKAFNSVSFFC